MFVVPKYVKMEAVPVNLEWIDTLCTEYGPVCIVCSVHTHEFFSQSRHWHWQRHHPFQTEKPTKQGPCWGGDGLSRGLERPQGGACARRWWWWLVWNQPAMLDSTTPPGFLVWVQLLWFPGSWLTFLSPVSPLSPSISTRHHCFFLRNLKGNLHNDSSPWGRENEVGGCPHVSCKRNSLRWHQPFFLI